MTLIANRIADMRRIVDAAGGRDLTKSQASDFRDASRDVLDTVTDTFDAPAIQDLGAAIKSSSTDLPSVVDAFEAWANRHNGGRKSAGRLIVEGDGPFTDSYTSTDLPTSYKATLNWGAEFEKSRTRAGKALLEVGSTAVTVPLATEPMADPRQATFVYQLIPSATAEGGSFGFLRQTVRTNNAAEVATGALKPTSIFTLERVNDTVKVFAHLTQPMDRFLLEDAPNLRQFLDQELRYGLAKAFDAHVLDEITTAATTGDAGTFDVAGVRSAITELQELDLEPNGIVMTPGDWETIETELTATYDANPGLPVATDAINRRLYGIPVMVSNSATAGQAIVGDFRGSARIYRTGSASITVHDSQPREVSEDLHADYALNQLVFRAEMRGEVAVWRPSGFIVVTEAS